MFIWLFVFWDSRALKVIHSGYKSFPTSKSVSEFPGGSIAIQSGKDVSSEELCMVNLKNLPQLFNFLWRMQHNGKLVFVEENMYATSKNLLRNISFIFHIRVCNYY